MTVSKIISSKNKEKIVMLTVYDYLTAKILENAGVDILLVGDSLGTAFMGYSNTLPVTMEDVIHHVRSVRNGAMQSFIVADMPFLSYGTSLDVGVFNAGRFMKESGANAIKLEGGAERGELIVAMTSIGIPVMGHIGLLPQSVNRYGYRIVGKTVEETDKLIMDAQALEKAGAFAMVIEGTTEEAAKAVTGSVGIPTIGIGAGRFTDGQVLVITDMLGMDPDTNLKHNKKYADLHGSILSAVQSYIGDVKSGKFPGEEQITHSS
ncbi:MAG: 3-methyl-2-oxobutanoate hydroxymethyltransferase [Brevinematales bacterium]|nr:3-methyl-2-oxobutanoate hydroxymethyltransferase [Brevinematales bacterium]